MHLTLVALVLLLVSLVLTFLQQLTNKMKIYHYYVPPSDARIEQLLPEEIFEHVLSFSDPLTLVRCHFVNKYWDYQSSKYHLQQGILQRAINTVRNLPGIQNVILGHQWLKYNADYPIKRRLSDFALAQKHGKNLLELSGTYLHMQNRDKFLLKTMAKLTYYPTFEVPGTPFTSFNNVYQFKSAIVEKSPSPNSAYANYELIVPLDECARHRVGGAMTLLTCRMTPVKYILGIFPLDGQLLRVMLLFFLPWLVRDILQYEPFMNVLNQWFGTVMFPVMALMAYNINITRTETLLRKTDLGPAWWKYPLLGVLMLFTCGFIAFYPQSANHFGFIACIMLLFYYGLGVLTHFFEFDNDPDKDPHSMHLKSNKNQLFLLVAMVLVTIDYSLVYRSIIDGTLFYRLFWNTLHWTLLAIYCILINALLSSILRGQSQARFKLHDFIDWDGAAVIAVLCLYVATLFATLYAPYWGYNS